MKNSLKKLRASASYIIPSILVFIYSGNDYNEDNRKAK